MKVILYDATCAFFTPGGKTTQFVKLQQEISKLGVDIEFARFWDESQSDANIFHVFTLDAIMAKRAKERGMKLFISLIFDSESNKTEFQKRKSILRYRLADLFSFLPFRRSWHALSYMDTIQFMHVYDKENALRYFSKYIDPNKVIIIPEAYDPSDMNISDDLDIQEMHFPEKYLVSVANISSRKQSVLLAKYAKKAKVPVVFMGKNTDTEEYFQSFLNEVDNEYVYYPGYVSLEWKDCIISHASGFALLSLGESGCCAVYEAAAYKIPLLLSNLPWAWGYDSPTDIHFCDQKNEEKAIKQLTDFYSTAGKLDHTPFKIYTWAEVAKKYVEQYEKMLSE